VTYFTSLILGLGMVLVNSTAKIILFIGGVFVASLSWQSSLACVGGLAHERLSARMQSLTFAVGNAVIIALGFMILLGITL
jgi:hypothetical protein